MFNLFKRDLSLSVLQNSTGFANFYRQRKTEADNSISDSKSRLLQIKENIISKITQVVRKNTEIRKWNGYYDDIINLEKDIAHIHNGVTKNASELDKSFNTRIVEIINND